MMIVIINQLVSTLLMDVATMKKHQKKLRKILVQNKDAIQVNFYVALMERLKRNLMMINVVE